MKGFSRIAFNACMVVSISVCGVFRSAQADQVTDALYAHSNGHLNGDYYRDATRNVADYWDCNGYSVRACQILNSLGYDCRIVVGNGHAFILVSGQGISPGYYEPQLGRILDASHANSAKTSYSLDEYLRTFNAYHCQMQLPPALAPKDDQVSQASVQSGESQMTQDEQGAQEEQQTQNIQVSQDGDEFGPEEWEHNGTRYRCPKGLTLIVMADGTLRCVTPQEAGALGATAG